MKKIRNRKLLNALHQFGLNPREWSLTEASAMTDKTALMHLLVNKEDPQFRLLGRADHKGWKALQLLSI
jgi:hypothetical protein